jgi:hypothetical protein
MHRQCETTNARAGTTHPTASKARRQKKTVAWARLDRQAPHAPCHTNHAPSALVANGEVQESVDWRQREM